MGGPALVAALLALAGVVLLSTHIEREAALAEASEELPPMPPVVAKEKTLPTTPIVDNYRQALGLDGADSGLTPMDEAMLRDTIVRLHGNRGYVKRLTAKATKAKNNGTVPMPVPTVPGSVPSSNSDPSNPSTTHFATANGPVASSLEAVRVNLGNDSAGGEDKPVTAETEDKDTAEGVDAAASSTANTKLKKRDIADGEPLVAGSDEDLKKVAFEQAKAKKILEVKDAAVRKEEEWEEKVTAYPAILEAAKDTKAKEEADSVKVMADVMTKKAIAKELLRVEKAKAAKKKYTKAQNALGKLLEKSKKGTQLALQEAAKAVQIQKKKMTGKENEEDSKESLMKKMSEHLDPKKQSSL